MWKMKSKKSKKEKSFYIAIFNRIKEGKTPTDIKNLYHLKRQHVRYYLLKLKALGFLDQNENKVWFAKVKTFSLGERRDTDLHAFNIRFPIMYGKINDSDWEIKNRLNNWLPKYKKFEEFEGLTIRNNNNKSITVFLKARKIDLRKDPYYVEKLGMKIKAYICEYFKREHKVILDSFEAETKNIHVETQDNEKLGGVLKKGEMFTVNLDRKASKIFPKDNMDAKAWADNSPDPNMIGSNDLEYKRDLLFMPVRTKQMLVLLNNSVPVLNYIAKNYGSHVGVVEELHKLLKQPRVRKYIKKKTNSEQTKIGDFI